MWGGGVFACVCLPEFLLRLKPKLQVSVEGPGHGYSWFLANVTLEDMGGVDDISVYLFLSLCMRLCVCVCGASVDSIQPDTQPFCILQSSLQ